MEIAEYGDCDLEIVSLTALLHDVDDYILVGEQTAYFNTRSFLDSIHYPESKTNIIINNISQISFKAGDTKTPDSIEGKIVQDADRLDTMGAIGIARAFTFGGNHNMPIYDPNIKGF